MTEIKLPWIDEEAIAAEHPTIFHYTNYLNLRSILESGGLLSTPYSDTNDREEFRAAKNILCPSIATNLYNFLKAKQPQFMERVEQDGHDPQEICEKDADTLYEVSLRTNVYKPYLTCFSYHSADHHKENGILSMWRSYCSLPGGIAVGFSTEKLIKRSNDLVAKYKFLLMFLDEAIYGDDTEKLKQRLDDCDDVIKINADFIHAKIERREPQIDTDALHKLLILSASIKHPDFSDEHEVRLVVSESQDENDTRDDVQKHGSRIIVEISDCISEILIGPSKDQSAIEAGVRHTLDAFGNSDVNIIRSNTPFRNL